MVEIVPKLYLLTVLYDFIEKTVNQIKKFLSNSISRFRA